MGSQVVVVEVVEVVVFVFVIVVITFINNFIVTVVKIIIIISVGQVELLASFALIVILTVYILIHSYNVKSNDPTNSILIAYINDCTSTIIWYPIAMLVCFVPYTCYDFYIVTYVATHGDNPPNGQVSILMVALPIL